MKTIKSTILHDLSLFVYYLVLMTEVLAVGFICLSAGPSEGLKIRGVPVVIRWA